MLDSFIRIFKPIHTEMLDNFCICSPNPPLRFSVHILSQVINDNPFSILAFFQKSSLLSLFIWLLVFNWKYCILCADNDSSWGYINTSLPALDMQFAIHSCSLVVTLWISFWKVESKGLPWKIGQNRNLPKESLCGIVKMLVTNCFCVKDARRESVSVNLW